MTGLVYTAILVFGNRIEESAGARAEVLELSRRSRSTDLSNDTGEATRTPELFSSSLSLSDLQSPMSFIEWTFLTFQARPDFRSNAPKKRRFTEAIRNRLGGGNGNGGVAASSFRDYEVDFRRSVAVVYKTHFVLEEGIIDWNRSPPPMASAPSIPSFHLYSRKNLVVVVDLFLKDPITWAFSFWWSFYYISRNARVIDEKELQQSICRTMFWYYIEVIISDIEYSCFL